MRHRQGGQLMVSVTARARFRRIRGEGGESLLEILITISVLGIGVVAILYGMATGIRLTGIQREQANADVALVAAAEAVKTYIPSPGTTCGTLTTATYAPALTGLTNLPPGWSTSDLSITSASCGTNQWPKIGVQASKGTGTESVEVVPRKFT